MSGIRPAPPRFPRPGPGGGKAADSKTVRPAPAPAPRVEPLRVLIADGEALGRQRMRELLAEETGVEVVGECADGLATLDAIRTRAPDLVVLDVCLPGVDGFGVLDQLGAQRLPVFIFVAPHHEFALRAFEVNAVDYLLKPVDRQRFHSGLNHVRRLLALHRTHRNAPDLGHLLTELRTQPAGVDRLTVKSTGRLLLVNVDDIEWVRGADNYVELHVGSQCHLLRQSLTSLQRRLPAGRFARISRSVLLNLNCIHELRRRTHGDYLVVLRDGTRLAGSRNYRIDLLRRG